MDINKIINTQYKMQQNNIPPTNINQLINTQP